MKEPSPPTNYFLLYCIQTMLVHDYNDFHSNSSWVPQYHSTLESESLKLSTFSVGSIKFLDNQKFTVRTTLGRVGEGVNMIKLKCLQF